MRDFVTADCELTTGAIAALTGAKLREGDPADRPIRNIAPLDTAGASDISFLDNSKYAGELATTRAAACLIAPRFVEQAPRSLVVLETAQPYPAFVAVTRKLFANLLRPTSLFGMTGRAASAQIDPTARLEAGVVVDPLAVIGPRAGIGAGTLIGPGVVIGPDVHIGRHCAIGAHASVLHALIGDRVIIHPGVRIGQDGFGFLPTRHGHQKIPQTRRVIIQDEVEIGANTTIDRGATRDTVVGEGTKIDNLVQIGHNFHWQALPDRLAGRHIGQRDNWRLRRAGRTGRRCRSFYDRRGCGTWGQGRSNVQRSRRGALGRLSG